KRRGRGEPSQGAPSQERGRGEPCWGAPTQEMIIGVPREIKPGEQRVALTPAGVRALGEAGHRVVVERDAGSGSSFRDEEYARESATLASVDEVWAQAEMILKVKEPIEEEYRRMRSGQIIFTYLHLAPAPALARALQQ